METKDLIRALRVALGMTQAQLAERAGFPQHTYVSRVEAGDNRLSTRKSRVGYVRGFGLTPEALDAYLDEKASLRDTVALAKASAGTAAPPRPELRVERDPTPHLDTSSLSTPLERAIGHAFDPKRHDWADGQDVLHALQRELHGHDRPEVDLIEAARRWLDAAHALRREGTPVTAATLLDRITLGKNPLLRGGSDSASEAMQREMIEHGERDGVTFGEGAAAIEEFRQRGKPAARDVDQAERELTKRAAEGIDETSGTKGRRG